MIRMESSENNTGYVDWIMDYPEVLDPFYPSLMSLNTILTQYKYKTVPPQNSTLDTLLCL